MGYRLKDVVDELSRFRAVCHLQFPTQERQHLVSPEIGVFRQLGILVDISNPVLDVVDSAPLRQPPVIRRDGNSVVRWRGGADLVRHLPKLGQANLGILPGLPVGEAPPPLRNLIPHLFAEGPNPLNRVRRKTEKGLSVWRTCTHFVFEIRTLPPYVAGQGLDHRLLDTGGILPLPERREPSVRRNGQRTFSRRNAANHTVVRPDEQHRRLVLANVPTPEPFSARLYIGVVRDVVGLTRLSDLDKHVLVRERSGKFILERWGDIAEHGDNRPSAPQRLSGRATPVLRQLVGDNMS